MCVCVCGGGVVGKVWVCVDQSVYVVYGFLQLLLILQMIVDLNGTVDKVDFARRIQNWMIHGFQELGDIGGMGIGMTVKRTLTHGLFIKDPHEAAKDVWEKSG